MQTDSNLYSTGGALRPTHLRTEHLVDPLGLDTAHPRLSWEMTSSRRSEMQTAFQVRVAESRAGLADERRLLWDSGVVQSDQTFDLEYGGKPLTSHAVCVWQVRLWDREGRVSPWSRPATWTEGMLSQDDWKGSEWIGYDKARPETATEHNSLLPPPVMMRTTFANKGRVRRATLYATALGWFDLGLNGQRVNDSFFDPGWTDYRLRVYYRAYDVTNKVKRGTNALGVTLADGWYSGYVGYAHQRDHYGMHPRFRAVLRLEYADGSVQEVVTGPDWKAQTGPTLYADGLQGESYDARLATPNWDTVTADDGTWAPVVTGAEVSPLIQCHPGPPVRVIQEIPAVHIAEPKTGVYVLNLGQNFAGVSRLKLKGEAGQKVLLRFAERLNPDGTIYTTNLRGAAATDTYICKGGGEEVWMPRFTFHGFQYVEITGLKHRPTADTCVGIALSSDAPSAGSFVCDDPMIEKLSRNTAWTQRANFIDIPTDCPQRDERLGWTGDAQIYIRTATLHADVQAFYTKWLVDLEDAQRADGQFPMVAPLKVAEGDGGPAWADAGVICPWTVYQVYGDKRELAKHYPSMCKFIDFCKNRSTGQLLPPEKFHCFGDWLNINDDTPATVIYTSYFAHSTHLVALSAEALGLTEDAAKWNHLFDQIKEAFNKTYIDGDGKIQGDSQTAYAMALCYDLVDGERATQAAEHLVANIQRRGNHLATGFVGTKDLMQALTKIHRNDLALVLLHNTTFPSWGFSIEHGATSIWERWDGWTPDKGFQDPGMNSFAHYSFGAVYQWMAENLGGIQTDGPAYKHIVIRPVLDPRMHHVKVGYRSIRGPIQVEWTGTTAKGVLTVDIPPNTTAVVIHPVTGKSTSVGSGRYRFAWGPRAG